MAIIILVTVLLGASLSLFWWRWYQVRQHRLKILAILEQRGKLQLGELAALTYDPDEVRARRAVRATVHWLEEARLVTHRSEQTGRLTYWVWAITNDGRRFLSVHRHHLRS